MKSNGKSCPICNSKSTLSPEDEEYIRCMNCGVIRTKYDYNATQYSTDYALNYLKYALSPCNKSLNLFRLGLVARWIKDDATILDIGCCVGEFIRFAENHYTCEGFEPNPVAAREAQKRTCSTIMQDLNGHKKYDCVTMFDVLEHIQDPVQIVEHISSILLPNGILAITTPNASACVGGLEIDRSWKHYKPKEHLFVYTNLSLKLLLGKVGLKVVHTGEEESLIRPGNPNGDIITCVAQKQ